MEFQFQTEITGLPIAKCDLECEAFGDWLSHDISNDQSKIAELLKVIDKLLNNQLNHYQFTGKIYHLNFADDEVELILNNNQVTHSEFADDYNDQNNSENSTGCGLIDFKHLLTEWADFVK